MFYNLKVKDHIRVPPTKFSESVDESVLNSLIDKFDGYVSEHIGFVMGVTSIEKIGEGMIIAGDGAAHYETVFNILTFRELWI